MDCYRALGRPSVTNRLTAVTLSLAGLALGGAVGCDHRISLDEFLRMQKAIGPAPTTQPATQPASKGKALKIPVEKLSGPLKIGPGDVLVVTVTGGGGQGAAGATIQARVRRDGTIELPLAGVVKVAGLELEDVEKTIKKRYQAEVYKEATVHVQAASVHTFSILVTGAVTTPGLVAVQRNQRNLLFAVVGAGGLSSMASGRVTLRRIGDTEKEVTLDLRDPEAVTTALALPPLEHGDMVGVEAANPNTVFVGGLVNGPSPQAYPPGTQVSVLQALAAAGGLRTDVIPREATLIRRMPNGKEVHVKLDLNRLGTGKDPNIQLAAGDILWVPHTIETRVEEWISKNIYFRAGANVGVTYNLIGTKDFLHGYRGGGQGTSLLLGGGSGIVGP